MSILEETIIFSNKDKIENENSNEYFNTFNPQNFLPYFKKEAFFIKLNNNFNYDKNMDLTIDEVKNIMEDSPKIDLDEENMEEIYFTKSPKLELQSTEGSTKNFSLTENKDEESFNPTINFTTVLHKKRGRKENGEKIKLNKKIHRSDDFDNIQRKIQVSFISFLVRLANDVLKHIFGKETKFHFKEVDYELKKIINHNYFEILKKCNYSDIMKMRISPKNKTFRKDENTHTLNQVCQNNLLKKFFEKNYLYMFQKYYCKIKNNNKEKIQFDGMEIELSTKTKTKTLFNLLKKNEGIKKKFINVVKDVYFSGLDNNLEKKFIINPTFK